MTNVDLEFDPDVLATSLFPDVHDGWERQHAAFCLRTGKTAVETGVLRPPLDVNPADTIEFIAGLSVWEVLHARDNGDGIRV